jgi:tRNA(Ile)-lysidine synthase
MEPVVRKFWDDILGQIRRYRMASAGESWLLAVSGGADSMAMLHALEAMRKDGLLDVKLFYIGHLNHRLRGADSDADAEFVGEAAGKLGLEAAIESADVAGYAQKYGLSIETAARNIRYEFLAHTARRFQCAKVAMAHNYDDQVETILHRILRGTGIRGLAGMPAVRVLDSTTEPPIHLVRPLLGLARVYIEQYLTDQKIPCRQDRTNFSEDYTRNRVRLALLPLLREQFNPQVDESLWRLGQIAEMFTLLSGERAGATLTDFVVGRGEGSLVLDADRLGTLPRFAQIEIIFSVMQELKISQRPIGFEHIMAAVGLLSEKTGTEKNLQWPGHMRIRRCGGELIFQTHSVSDDDGKWWVKNPPYSMQQEILLAVPGVTEFSEDAGFTDAAGLPIRRITTEVMENRAGLLEQFIRDKTPNEEMLDFDKIQPPLSLRCRRSGDRFRSLGAPGDKSLGDFFTDHKVPVSVRDRLAILCDPNGILGILRLKIADASKVTSMTERILKLTVE